MSKSDSRHPALPQKTSSEAAVPSVKTIGPDRLVRRDFVKTGALTATAAAITLDATAQVAAAKPAMSSVKYEFDQQDSLCFNNDWESLNPGFWQIKGKALRRRLSNYGDRARRTGFPFHYANNGKKMPTDYDPSLPPSIVYRRDWNLVGSYSITAEFTYRNDRPLSGGDDNPEWKHFQPGYGRMGIAFGAKSLFESYDKTRNVLQLVWSDDGKLRFVASGKQRSQKMPSAVDAPKLKRGDQVSIAVAVEAVGGKAKVKGTLATSDESVTIEGEFPASWVEGFVGVSGQGLVDFEVNSFSVEAAPEAKREVQTNECSTCYALGDTLREDDDGRYRVKFVGLFETDGSRVELRIATEEKPAGGWQTVPVAGSAKIVNHSWRRNTAVVDALLPVNPAESDLYYTVWKDGVDVTQDPRVGNAATGAGTGLVGDVPSTGSYVGRLPQLIAPYKLCGLSCHAITSGLQQPVESGFKMTGGGDDWQFRDQPTEGAYKSLEDYKFQVMVWEDDVWYMELVLYPPSTDDAYKIVKHTICGPTSRWQMMRHWNVINPGDHDYGMDDVKGPEQIAIRTIDGLGQDASYMRRNFQIVHHLVTGEEEVDPRINPKKWRAWKMPNRDFTFVILDSRLWRSSQDTDMWDDSGWEAFKNLYDRTDPTRSLLGEEQFAWLQSLLESDSSPLVCITGLNGLHTVWAGAKYKGGRSEELQGDFNQRDRVTADYAGWVKAGADRVIELLGSRTGVVSVYGDVHNGCIMKNTDHGVIECSFGPIGRSGGRALIQGFGRKMKDFDGRPVDIYSLYHKNFSNPDQDSHAASDPFYWNFLEMEFHPWKEERNIELRVRNMIDSPAIEPRGGGQLITSTRETGRPLSCRLPNLKVLPNADVLLMNEDNQTIRGTRSSVDGSIDLEGLQDIEPGTKIILTANDGKTVQSQFVETLPLS